MTENKCSIHTSITMYWENGKYVCFVCEEKLKKQNESLLKKFGVRGFPTIVLLNSKGEKVGKTGYQPGGPEAYIKHLKEIFNK